jgi:exopolysaccharide production protein ExoQ
MPIKTMPIYGKLTPISALLAMAVAASMIFGGGGSGWPLPELVLQCILAGFSFVWIWMLTGATARMPTRQALFLAAILIGLPVLQLIPLPPILWHNMAGREVEVAALQLIGGDQHWQPWSMTPERTLASLLAMAPMAVLLLMASTLERAERNLILTGITAVALLSLLVGAGQLSGENANIFRFYLPGVNFLNGFQSHHNHQADILLIAMVALTAVAKEYALGRGGALHLRYFLGFVGGASLLLGVGVILTASRSGMMLLPVPIFAQLWLLRRWLKLGRGQWLMAMTGLGIFALILAIALSNNAVLARVFGRFQTATEFRPEIWHDTIYAIRHFLPWGSGLGSFIPIFTSIERLEVVSDLLTNRAHNDYLELMLEAGIPGAVLFMVAVLQIGRAAWRGIGDSASAMRAQNFCSVIILVIIGLHSLIDYPMRSMSLAAIAAVCAGFLLATGKSGDVQVSNTVRDNT